MKKLFLFLMAVISLGLTARGADGDQFTVDNLKYTVLSEADRTVQINGFVNEPTDRYGLWIPDNVSNNGMNYSVTEIGDNAFQSVYWLTEVRSGGSITKIGNNAFYFCRNIEYVDIWGPVVSIGDKAFYYCESLESVEFPETVVSLGEYAFSGTAITSMILPDSVTSIGFMAFRSCSNLVSVYIPKLVEYLDSTIFESCSSLEEITVDEENNDYASVEGVLYTKNIDKLICCPGGKTGQFKIPENVAIIDVSAFQACKGLTSVIIPQSVNTIERFAFAYCSGLTSIEIPSQVTTINNSTFTGCSRLKNVYLPDGLTTMLDFCFQNCASLTTFVIPKSVTRLGAGQFTDCENLNTVYSLPEVAPVNYGYNIPIFMGIRGNIILYYPKGSESSYESSSTFYESCVKEKRAMGIISVGLDRVELTLEKGNSASISPVILNPDGVEIYAETWNSSNPDVVSVDSGLVTALSEGSAVITYILRDEYGLSQRATCQVEVTIGSGVDGISVEEGSSAEYYNLNGIRVSEDGLAPGLYIKRQGGKTEKVIVK